MELVQKAVQHRPSTRWKSLPANRHIGKTSSASAVRRDIFVEPQPKNKFSSIGAAYSGHSPMMSLPTELGIFQSQLSTNMPALTGLEIRVKHSAPLRLCVKNLFSYLRIFLLRAEAD